MPATTAKKPRTTLFSLNRIWVIATNTFTQLVRMKVFYFLAFFAFLIIGAQFIEMPYTSGPESIAHEKLRMVKGPAFAAMTLFSVIFSITATALLIPRDLEERTLYTILSKPVPRLDYLVGKLLGVLLVIAVSLLLMDLLMTLMLWVKSQGILTERLAQGQQMGWDQATTDRAIADIQNHGPTWSLQAGVVAIFLRAIIIASIALLISTFSSSTLFTIVITLLIYFIGLMVGGVQDYWANNSDTSSLLLLFGKFISTVLPNFKIFNVIDGAIGGQIIPAAILLKLTITSLIYGLIYTILSWFTFQDKEF